MSPADEGAAGISASPGDEGAALQRAQDKIATMQARAGALDELPQSAVPEDVGSDDTQQELEAGSPPKWTRSSPRMMFFLPAYPFWALVIIAVDMVALYGLCA